MKQIFKKISTVCTAMLCAAAITVGGAGAVWGAADEDALKQQMTFLSESLTQSILPLSDEEIANYKNSSDAFTIQAMESWESAKEELGAKTEEDAGETEISFTNGEYTVTVPVAFEKYDAEFEYVFDDKGTPTSMAVNVIYPLSVTLKNAGLNTVMGIGTVFIMLIFLSFVIYLFKFIPNGDKKKKEAAQAPAPAPVAVAEPELTDDGELIAVIAAAIAASEGTTTDGFVVRSIRKVNRKRR